MAKPLSERQIRDRCDDHLRILFQTAMDGFGWGFNRIADESGCAYATIANLYSRWNEPDFTSRCQHITLIKFANAVGLSFDLRDVGAGKRITRTAAKRPTRRRRAAARK